MRLFAYIAVVLFLLLGAGKAFGQVVRWASKVEFEYNAFEGDGIAFKGIQALGPPDAYPYGELSPRAYRLKSESAYGRLVVSFDEPMEATQIWILESYLPGRITKVILFDTNNDKYAAFDGKPQALTEPYRNFVIDLGKRTSYKIQKIEINLISIQAPGWAQIDAIGISDTSPQVVAQELELLNQKAVDPSARLADPIPELALVNAMEQAEVEKRLEELEALRLAEEEKRQEEERLAREAAEKQRLEEEALKAEEAKRLREEENERQRKAEQEQRKLEELRRQEEALKKAQEEAKAIAAEAERERLAEEMRKAEVARKKAEEEEAKRRAEEEFKRKAEEQARKQAEDEAMRQAAEERQLREEALKKDEEERRRREAEIRQLREIQRVNAQAEVKAQVTLPPLPPELAALESRKEVALTNLSPARIELIRTRRQLDIQALAIAPQQTGSFIQSVTISQQSLGPEIPEDFRRQSVGDGINTPYAEVKPIITADGQTLYFSRQNYPENIGGEKDAQDIYVAHLDGGEWGMAYNIGSPLNNDEVNGIVAVSGDGNTVLLINEYGPLQMRRSKNSTGVSISNRDAGAWSMPQPLDIQNHYNKSNYVDYFLSNDRKVMILAVERRDTRGDQDLYVSFNLGENRWSEPKSMGPVINSKEADFSPFLAADNRTLYFASYGHNSLGGPDIFMSKRLDKSWTSWSTPVNLGSTINSPGFEAYFTIPASGDYAYLVTDQGGIEESRDIYIVAIPPQFMPDPVLTVMGRMLDVNTLEPLEGKLAVESILDGYESAAITTDSQNGEYQFILPANDQYQLRAIAPGYLPANELLDLTEIAQSTTIEKTIYMRPLNQSKVSANANVMQSQAMVLNQNKEELDKTNRVVNVEEKFLTLEWLVKNELGRPLEAQIVIIAEGDSSLSYQINAGGNGRATIALPYGQDYVFISSVKGYFNESGMIDFRSFSSETPQTISLLHKEMPTGITETLPNIMFEQGLDKLLDVAYPELDSLAEFLLSHPSVRIKLDGHTDAIGDAQLNVELSLKRVEMVKSYLVRVGVQAERIQLEAFGGSKPIASNASERTRRLNRRVEWTIIEN